MSIDKEILDRLMEGRAAGDLFGKSGILSELTKALAERALNTEMDVHRHCCRSQRVSDQPLSPFGSGNAFNLGGAEGVKAVHD